MVLSNQELTEVYEKYQSVSKKLNKKVRLMVGYNRRFSKFTDQIKDILNNYKNIKKFITYTINAGQLPKDHWTLDQKTGGGRFLGEGVHFIDYVYYLINLKIIEYNCVGSKNDGFSLNLKFIDGTIANINYITNSPESLPKENIEISFDDKKLILENFSNLKFTNFGMKFNKVNLSKDKGQKQMLEKFL